MIFKGEQMGGTEKTRQHIIEKAAPIFNMYGYEGTSMSQLTQAIKMTKGAIYGNFRDKDEIAMAAFDYNVERISKLIRHAVHSKEDACDRLVAYANFYLDAFPEISDQGGCPMLNAAVDSDNARPLLKEKVSKAIGYWMKSISGIVYNGVKSKQIHPNVKPEQFASVFVSLIEGGLMLSKVTGNTIHLSRNIDHIIHLVNTELRV